MMSKGAGKIWQWQSPFLSIGCLGDRRQASLAKLVPLLGLLGSLSVARDGWAVRVASAVALCIACAEKRTAQTLLDDSRRA